MPRRSAGPPGGWPTRSSSATTRTADLVLIGLQTGGVWIASRLARVVGEVTGHEVVVGTLDVAFYRDDYGLRPVLPEAATEIPVDLTAGRWSSSTTCCSPGGPSEPPSAPSATTAGPGPCSWR